MPLVDLLIVAKTIDKKIAAAAAAAAMEFVTHNECVDGA